MRDTVDATVPMYIPVLVITCDVCQRRVTDVFRYLSWSLAEDVLESGTLFPIPNEDTGGWVNDVCPECQVASP